MAKALTDTSKLGKIISIDCISHNESIYWNCIDDFEGPKTRNELLSKWSKELSRIVFIQGWTDSLIQRIGLLVPDTEQKLYKNQKIIKKLQL